MKMQFKSAIVVVLAIVGLSIYGGRGGFHGGGHGGYHGGGWNRGGWNRGGWGWGAAPAVGFGIGVSSAPRIRAYNCSYAELPDSYFRYQREFRDPIDDQYGYKNWLKANYNDWSDQWEQFQRYLDYEVCSRSSSKPRVGVSVGVGAGYYGSPYRRGYWRR